MVRYRRNFVPGGTFFFTVTLDDRKSSALVDHVALLRAAFRKTRSERPFVVEAIVILPDHLHAIMTLPPGDSDFSDRWRRIKGSFTRSVVAAGIPISRDHRGEYSVWQKRFCQFRRARRLTRIARSLSSGAHSRDPVAPSGLRAAPLRYQRYAATACARASDGVMPKCRRKTRLK
jgi:REP element-mobilizing transposase RayT